MISLTDGSNDDDGVKESAGKGPLDVILTLAAIPTLFLHHAHEIVLKALRRKVAGKWWRRKFEFDLWSPNVDEMARYL